MSLHHNSLFMCVQLQVDTAISPEFKSLNSHTADHFEGPCALYRPLPGKEAAAQEKTNQEAGC